MTPPIGSTLPRSVISPVIATSRRAGIRASAEISAVASVMPADGPSFGIAPSGMCTCTSRRRLKSFGDAELLGARAHVAHRRLRRLLHHVAELAGERQPAAAGHERRFGDENLAADFGPRQAGGDADFVLLFGERRAVARARRGTG